MNQADRVQELSRAGWRSFMPSNELGWKFFYRSNPELDHYFFGPGNDYLTIFPNGTIAEGIIETPHQRWKRRRAEILFRDFRDYPRWK